MWSYGHSGGKYEKLAPCAIRKERLGKILLHFQPLFSCQRRFLLVSRGTTPEVGNAIRVRHASPFLGARSAVSRIFLQIAHYSTQSLLQIFGRSTHVSHPKIFLPLWIELK